MLALRAPYRNALGHVPNHVFLWYIAKMTLCGKITTFQGGTGSTLVVCADVIPVLSDVDWYMLPVYYESTNRLQYFIMLC